MRRLWRWAWALPGALVVAVALDVWRQYPGEGPAVVLGGTLLALMFLGAYSFPVLLVLGLLGAEVYALWHLARRRDLGWRGRLLWGSAVIVLTPWFAAGAIAYLLVGRAPRAAPAPA